MVSFPKPKFAYSFDLNQEISALREERDSDNRGLPGKTPETLLLATWNIANLGQHQRDEEHYRLLAEIISWYDLVAVQEVADKLVGINSIMQFLPATYRKLFNDPGGNNERGAFIYDSSKLTLLEKVGEVAIPPSAHRYIKLPGVRKKFTGFDRNPYLASFRFKNFEFIVLNLHIFFGSNGRSDINRRSLETYAVGRWADLRRDDQDAYNKNILVMGDMNLPMIDDDDPIYSALTKRGLVLPEHSTRMYSNIANDKQYDQIAFFPGMKRRIRNHGVFSYDMAVFADLWAGDGSLPAVTNHARFRAYCKYFVSDHRPMWIELGAAA